MINKQIDKSKNKGLFNKLLRECEFKIVVKKKYLNGLMIKAYVRELNIVERMERWSI